jgi:hypothetical protein
MQRIYKEYLYERLLRVLVYYISFHTVMSPKCVEGELTANEAKKVSGFQLWSKKGVRFSDLYMLRIYEEYLYERLLRMLVYYMFFYTSLSPKCVEGELTANEAKKMSRFRLLKQKRCPVFSFEAKKVSGFEISACSAFIENICMRDFFACLYTTCSSILVCLQNV